MGDTVIPSRDQSRRSQPSKRSDSSVESLLNVLSFPFPEILILTFVQGISLARVDFILFLILEANLMVPTIMS